MQIGKAIKKFRIEQGLSMEQLGEMIGSNKTYISSVESGKKQISENKLQEFATALKINPYVLKLYSLEKEDVRNEYKENYSEILSKLKAISDLIQDRS